MGIEVSPLFYGQILNLVVREISGEIARIVLCV